MFLFFNSVRIVSYLCKKTVEFNSQRNNHVITLSFLGRIEIESPCYACWLNNAEVGVGMVNDLS